MSEIASIHNDEITQSVTQSVTADKNIICLEKEELLNNLYKLNEDNVLLTEQLKQYRIMVEALEQKLSELNNTQNNKHRQITDVLLKLLMHKRSEIQKGGSKSHSKRRSSKRSKKHPKRSEKHSKRSEKHSKRSKNKSKHGSKRHHS